MCSSIHPSIQSINKYMSAYYVAGTVLGAGDTIVKNSCSTHREKRSRQEEERLH
jgi:hypothetical protein